MFGTFCFASFFAFHVARYHPPYATSILNMNPVSAYKKGGPLAHSNQIIPQLQPAQTHY